MSLKLQTTNMTQEK